MLYRKDCKCHLCDPVEPAGQHWLKVILENVIEIVFDLWVPIDFMKIRGSTGTKSQAITGILKDINECFWIVKEKGHMHVLPIDLSNRLDLLIYGLFKWLIWKCFRICIWKNLFLSGFHSLSGGSYNSPIFFRFVGIE